MSPLKQLQSILNESYVSEDGDEFKIELKPGLTDEQIGQLAKDLPTGQIPSDIRDLLRFASGKPDRTGFAWGKFGPNIDNAVRHKTELIWGVETRSKQAKPGSPGNQNRKGFFSRLFGR